MAGAMVGTEGRYVKDKAEMEVITTHIDAEFDSFASMVAAGKLYPRARLVFPGSQEKALRKYLRSSTGSFGLQRAKSIDLDRVRRLILVDTRRRDRIGPFAGIVDRKGVEVHVYDHHPQSSRDIAGKVEVVEDAGANITIMVEQLRKRKLTITPEEATLFAIALYEDTGSLTFASTTPRDLRTGAWLLEQGANLNVVADNLGQELSPEQVMILNDLLRNLRRITVREVEVAVATASTGRYVADLSVVTHRLRDMENLSVLFVAVRMGDRIHLVARSRIEAVDAGEVAFHFGGGGHPTAASATIHSRRLSDVTVTLRKVLRSCISPPLKARDIMTSPVRSLEATTSIAEARQMQNRTGLHIIPVVEDRRFRGLITRPVTERAIQHGFGEAPVSDYMASDVEVVGLTAPFSKVEEVMVEQGQRLLPVVDRRRLAGVITRTDYLRALRREAAKRPPFGYERRLPRRITRQQDMSSLVRDRLPPPIRRLLEVIGREGDQRKVSVYLVGGVVRDLLLNEQNFDLDIMVEGDGIQFARHVGKILGGRVNSYKRFETAVVVLPGGRKIDVATARAEYYESPGAFPKVEHGSIKMDLFRRDFTVNALALQLNREKFGTLHDFFGGQKDLEDGRIRVLHNLSFVEDPTRVFRAIRFEARLNFRLGEVTHRLIKDAVAKDLLDYIVGPRLYAELVLILRERNPLPALARLRELDLLKYIHPKMRVTRTVLRIFRKVKERLEMFEGKGECDQACFYLAALAESLGPRQQENLMERLAVPPRPRNMILGLLREGHAVQKIVEGAQELTAGEVWERLASFPLPAVFYAWSRTTRRHASSALRTFLLESVHVTACLRGKDLKKMGYPPGPSYRVMLAELRKARIDGLVADRTAEKEWILSRYPLAAGV